MATVSSRPAKIVTGVAVFVVGLLVGAGIAMWFIPPT
jgi:hypothetical protein